MDQQEAFEILSDIAGRPLSLNGVHGEDLKKIATYIAALRLEKLRTAEAVADMIARSMTPQKGQLLAIQSSFVDRHLGQALTKCFPDTPVLIFSGDDSLDNLSLREASELKERIESLFPQLSEPAVNKEKKDASTEPEGAQDQHVVPNAGTNPEE